MSGVDQPADMPADRGLAPTVVQACTGTATLLYRVDADGAREQDRDRAEHRCDSALHGSTVEAPPAVVWIGSGFLRTRLEVSGSSRRAVGDRPGDHEGVEVERLSGVADAEDDGHDAFRPSSASWLAVTGSVPRTGVAG